MEIVVGAPHSAPNGLLDQGLVEIFSGASGGLLYTRSGLGAGDNFGRSVTGIGDINLDGTEDVLIGALSSLNGQHFRGAFHVLSGASGTWIHQVFANTTFSENSLGFCAAPLGDIDLDGVPDFIVGAPFASPGGSFTDIGMARVYSGLDATALMDLEGEASHMKFGKSVASVDDADHDGVRGILIGSPYGYDFALEEDDRHGSATLVSGATGEVMHRWFGADPHDHLGEAVASLGDPDADGHPDFLLGSPRDGAIGQVPSAGFVQAYDYSPSLEVSTYTMSVSAGGVQDLTIDFPTAMANSPYLVVFSREPSGIQIVPGIPLALDDMFLDSVQGIYTFSTRSGLQEYRYPFRPSGKG